jgi:hypothetical protein
MVKGYVMPNRYDKNDQVREGDQALAMPRLRSFNFDGILPEV